jgi:hypothetical protein
MHQTSWPGRRLDSRQNPKSPRCRRNKQTGFVVGVLFLEMTGHRFTASEEEAAQALRLAAGILPEATFAVWLHANLKTFSLFESSTTRVYKLITRLQIVVTVIEGIAYC